ncbi:MAG: S-adenosylmethionine decarboxylase [Myxococcales bacterium]|nr:S-adenosylmethionine decarboxylase [Myxococcales bacterium]
MFRRDALTETFVDADGCAPLLLRDAERQRLLLDEIVTTLELHVVGQPQWFKFPGEGGVTGLYLLSESHLSIHTYPEWGLATLNLYCCRPRPDFDWEGRLRTLLEAGSVSVRTVSRGLSP